MFYSLDVIETSPVEPQKLDRVEHHMCVDGAGRIWLIDARGHFSYTEPEGDLTTRLSVPDLAPISTSMNVLWHAPCGDGFIVESKQHGVLRVTPDAVLALREPGDYQIAAVAADMSGGEFLVLDRMMDPQTYKSHHVLSHYSAQGELLATHDPGVLTGEEVNTTYYNMGLAIDQDWIVLATREQVTAISRGAEGAQPARFEYKGDERLHLRDHILSSISTRSVYMLDLRSGEVAKHPVTSLAEGSVGITGVDFGARIIIMKENNGDQRCRLVQFDESSASLHPFDEVLRTKRLSSCYGVHLDPLSRLWLAVGRGKSTRFVILNEKGKNVKFQKPE